MRTFVIIFLFTTFSFLTGCYTMVGVAEEEHTYSSNEIEDEELQIEQIFHSIYDELSFALNKYGSFNSAHEGYAIILEEMDELWDEIKAKQGSRDWENIEKESIQVAAMTIRFIFDIVLPNKESLLK